jgi:transposase-like protein
MAGRVPLPPLRARQGVTGALHALAVCELWEQSIQPGSVVHTDGWLGYAPLQGKGYRHQITPLRGQPNPSELLPRVHRVISLLKRWLLGTHQGAVSLEHLDYYLDEFTFRFNRRRSKSRGKLFLRLVQQAMAVEPSTYKSIVNSAKLSHPNHNLLGLPE